MAGQEDNLAKSGNVQRSGVKYQNKQEKKFKINQTEKEEKRRNNSK